MLTKKDRVGLRTWIEISRKAILNNYKIFRNLVPKSVKLMAVVKSNAYGHGLVDFSKAISQAGVDWLGVDSLVEGLRLRKEGIMEPILVLGYTLPERIQEAVNANISIALSSLHGAQELAQLKTDGKIAVHIKIDSGMHRQGFMEHEREHIIFFLKEHADNISVEGLFTHFASAKDPEYPEATNKQRTIFEQWITAFKVSEFSPIIHAAATGATLLYSNTYYDMVRVGIGFHGYWPSEESGIFSQKNFQLTPTLTWKTIISEMKTVPEGEGIGYDFTHILKRDTRVAICPIGYWHGYPRNLSNKGIVLVNNVRVPVIGRVSMDMITIDITDVPEVQVGDEVVLLGSDESESITVDEIAKLAGDSSYELITRINPLIKKFYI